MASQQSACLFRMLFPVFVRVLRAYGTADIHSNTNASSIQGYTNEVGRTWRHDARSVICLSSSRPAWFRRAYYCRSTCKPKLNGDVCPILDDMVSMDARVLREYGGRLSPISRGRIDLKQPGTTSVVGSHVDKTQLTICTLLYSASCRLSA
ncbi:hypothetical protein BDP55DRAFT_21013 [Colletotrichum godetiae]|uniref:Secreted protein n=1 Tax=Colletotrichum godetiae TaxID=1209918 RepID=A0AAJ0B071_9PEZI|nr:uncharacterized protein BDP55DRAFT_21013 [Colletotrichum godetiae]KAK1701435.1 hypothetical protein BDP55DRAFT_21013 [Colletotrichum godetiae]